MQNRLYRATLLVAYQFTVTLGVLLMPLALAARQAGLRVPFERILSRLDSAIESTQK